MSELLILLSTGLFILTLPTFIELVLLLIGDHRFKALRGSAIKKQTLLKRAVVIPAHNEEKCLPILLERLKRCRECFDVVVVADNCQDRSAEIARDLGVRVVERHEPSKRGKPFALNMIFEKLLEEDYDWIAVLDADSLPDDSFFEEVNQHLGQGFLALQGAYSLVYPRYPSYKELWDSLAFGTFNLIRLRGRSGLGLSCGIFGNGFVLHRSLIEQVPYTVNSIVEDLAYHVKMIQNNKSVHFIPFAKVFASVPKSDSGTATQQSRWIGGKWRALREEYWSMAAALFSGNTRFLEPLLDLLSLPLSYQGLCLLLLVAISPALSLKCYALLGLTLIFYYLWRGLHLLQRPKRDLFALALYFPLSIAKKILLLPQVFSAACHRKWHRTERDD